MTPSVTASNSTPPATSPSTTSSAASASVNKNMFLQLLVAQLQNQDPMNPSDGTTFITQLAQFQQLEQSVNSGQDITGIRSDLDQLVAQSKAATPPVGTSGTGSTTTGTQG